MYTCTNGLFYDTRCTLRCQDPAENVGINSEGGVLLPSQRVRNLQLGSDPAVLFHAGVRLSPLTDSCSFSPLVLKLLLILFFSLKCVSSSLHTHLWLSWSVLKFSCSREGGGGGVVYTRHRLTVLSEKTLLPGTNPGGETGVSV